jgi:hypothetical protein
MSNHIMSNHFISKHFMSKHTMSKHFLSKRNTNAEVPQELNKRKQKILIFQHLFSIDFPTKFVKSNEPIILSKSVILRSCGLSGGY